MTNMLQDGAEWLGARLQEAAGRAITYTRGATSVSLTAWLSEHRTEEIGIAGVVLERNDSLDVSIMAADLILSGSVTLPARGDRIAIVRGSSTHTYEVVSQGDEPPYTWPDAERTLLTIHAKQVS